MCADLRVAEPDEALAKSELAALIVRALLARTTMAEMLGIGPTDVWDLMRGRLTCFSTEQLIQLLTRVRRNI